MQIMPAKWDPLWRLGARVLSWRERPSGFTSACSQRYMGIRIVNTSSARVETLLSIIYSQSSSLTACSILSRLHAWYRFYSPVAHIAPGNAHNSHVVHPAPVSRGWLYHARIISGRHHLHILQQILIQHKHGACLHTRPYGSWANSSKPTSDAFRLVYQPQACQD